MIVTIDGPAGSGKSSVARRLAKRLNFKFLDTGAMYRAVAWSLLQQSVDLDDEDQVVDALDQIKVELENSRTVKVNGRDVTDSLRTGDVSQAASVVAAIPEVRRHLVDRQREIAQRGHYVCEGRDQGTVAFPNAECKVFLTAAPEIRAQRRYEEMKPSAPELELEDVIAEQKIRDLRDETRKTGRLEKATDAVEIRVDDLSLDEVVDRIESLVRTAMTESTTGQ